MSRLFLMTFHGQRRWDDHDVHPHESPALMTVPMMVLAVGSAFLGLALGPTGVIQSWLEPVVGTHGEENSVLPPIVITILTLLLVALGAGLAYLRYVRSEVPVAAPTGSLLTRAARRDLLQDDVNEALLMRPGQHLTRSLVFLDGRGVDGAVGGLAALVGGTSSRLRRWQTGFVRSYALSMLAGVVVLLAAVAVIS
jgi:NADH-quinone oxidoreductase subunit L